jgi:predicted metal-dependent hydrolase
MAPMQGPDERFQLPIDGVVIQYSIRFSARARRLQIRVGPSGAELVLPMGVDPSVGHQFVVENAAWVLSHVKTAAAQPPQTPMHPPLREARDEVFEHNGQRIAYTLKPAPRARRMRVAVGAAGVELLVPPGMDLALARAFLQKHGDWVIAHIAKRAARVDVQTALPPNAVLWRGQLRSVQVVRSDQNATVRDIDGAFVVRARTAEIAQRALRRWMQRQAAALLNMAVAEHAARMTLHPQRVALRDQQTRWGSCSSRGTVSFNWRLVHAPPDVLVYVVVHELAHLREMNHSPRFWALVEAYCPDFQRNSAWLKREGWRLRQDAQLAL